MRRHAARRWRRLILRRLPDEREEFDCLPIMIEADPDREVQACQLRVALVILFQVDHRRAVTSAS
jgi:hypothetical protein